jgi:type I restriction enzyme, S subunit
MRLPPYPRYKPTGDSWAPELPDSWELVRLRWLSERYAGGTPDKNNSGFWDDGDIPWLNSGSVNDGYITEPSAFITREGFLGSSAKWIPKGSLVMALAGQGKTKGMVAQLGFPATCNQSMAAIIPNHRIRARYLYWWLTANYSNIRNMAGGEARDGLNLDLLGGIPCPIPGDDEQRAIADVLDRETAKIDTLVSKKRTLIERLKEKRTALISRMVTRGLPPDAARAAGLDPHPKLKPSGIDWLGDVPEHWGTSRVGHRFRNLDHRRVPIAGEDRSSLDKIYPYYGASGVIDYVDKYIFDETLILVAEDGANLLSRSTPLAFLASGKYWVNNHAHILKPVDGDIRYWVAMLQCFDYTPLITGAAQPKLTSDRLGSIVLPQPPDAEQEAIADFLDRETAKIHGMVTKVETAIERLQEYRTALITAAVTGRIDVRGAAA